jgi:hypothetical protein
MRYIDQKQIFDKTNQGLTVFEHFFPHADLKDTRKKFKLRDKEKTASARVTWHNGLWRITDFGNQGEVNGLNCIDFVKWFQGMEYYDALQYIEQVIIHADCSSADFQKSKFAPDYEWREMEPDDKKKEYKFTFKEKPSKSDLSVIGRYVNKEILELFDCKVIEKYEYCSTSIKHNKDVVHIFKSNETYPIFLFDYGTFKKLYRPLDKEKKNRFLYIGEKPKKYIYGLKQLKKSDNEFTNPDADDEEAVKRPDEKPDAVVRDLFRCSGESDAMNLAALGFHVYWLNSESAELAYDEYKELDDMCENHYQIMDLDPTGRTQAMKNAMKYISLYNIELPEWLRLKDDWRGNPCKDLKDFVNISGDDEDQTRYNFLVLKRNARRVKFWHKSVNKKDKNEDIQINMEYFFFFLRANGFYQMESIYHKKAGYCYVQVTNNKMVELIHPDDMKRRIKRFTKDWIKSKNLMDGVAILNKITTSAQLTEGNFETIDEIKCNFKNYDRETEYMHFRNCSIRITRDKIERIKHDDVPNYILKELKVAEKVLSQMVDRNMQVIEKVDKDGTKQFQPAIEVNATPEYQKLLDRKAAANNDDERQDVNVDIAQFPETDKYQVTIHDKEFIFTNFMRDISRLHWRKELEKKQELTLTEKNEEMQALANLMFVLGYHCAQYKDPGKPWLTFLQDMKISEIGHASGRSGKSVFESAPTYVRISFYKGGRALVDKNVYQFFYDGFTEFHDYIEIDDIYEYADFSFFYTQITGKREINPKNYTPFTLDYKDSGKMLISSNYELPNIDNSMLARLLNAGVSDYYHEATKFNDYKETRSPLTKYARRLYEDFTDEEWVKFYNFVAYCIQLQMRFDKINPPMGDLEKRQLRRAMTTGLGRDEDFFKWANDYFIKPDFTPIPEFSPKENGYFNTLVIRENAFDNFRTRLSRKQESDYRSGKFKHHLQAWCDYWGYVLNPTDKCTDRDHNRIIRTIDGASRECFYISSLKPPEEPGKPFVSDDPKNNPVLPFVEEDKEELPF